MPHLKIYIQYKGKESTQIITKDRFIVGRPDLNNTVDINMHPDRRVSRQHVELYYEDGVWWARDKGSKRGTEHNRNQDTIGEITEREPVEIMPSDEIIIGESTLRFEFQTDAIDPAADWHLYEEIDESSAVDLDPNNVEPPSGVGESKFLEIWAGFTEITNSELGDTMLQLALERIRSAYNEKARFINILIRTKDKEMLPQASLPRGSSRARFSYTLARQAIRRGQGFRWPDPALEIKAPDSMDGILEAIYAPIVADSKMLGVLNVGTDEPNQHFSLLDVKLLTVMAQALGPAIQRDWDEDAYRHTAYPQVFISYSRQNRDFVTALASDIRKRFIRVWMDDHIEGGVEWEKQLDKAIANADALIFVISPDSVESPHCKRELGIARKADKRIFTVMHQDATPPGIIYSENWIMLGEDLQNDVYNEGLLKLIEEVRLHVQESA